MAVPLELGVLEYLVQAALPFGFVEVVHVKLPYKRAIVAMLEEHREYLMRELGLVNNHKSLSIVSPPNNFLRARLTQDVVDFNQES
jgi:hypothetical protein